MHLTEEQFQKILNIASNETEHWFSRDRQKKMAFEIARELYLDGATADEAVVNAKSFINTFYNNSMKYGSWEL